MVLPIRPIFSNLAEKAHEVDFFYFVQLRSQTAFSVLDDSTLSVYFALNKFDRENEGKYVNRLFHVSSLLDRLA